MSTNVPYLAWRGEHVRLVKCTGDLPPADDEIVAARSAATGADDIFFGLARTDVIVEDWSGDADFKPTPAAGTIDVFLSPNDGICVKADVISQRAGLAAIKLLVTIDAGANSPHKAFIDLLTRSELLVAHQYLAGWMNLETPTLTELPIGGDAATLNDFRAGDDAANEGVARVTVSGNMPLGNGFSELGLGASISMPAGWPALAAAMASDRNPDNQNPRYRWDIHDDTTAVEGHPSFPNSCNNRTASPDLAPRGDAVDNCQGGLRFSRYFDADGPGGPLAPLALGLTTADSIGPFDPQRPDQTLLGDGALTADDAPMPAARVDVEIAAGLGGADIGGAGSLRKTDKRKVFSRDRLATANAGSGNTTAHNLYAPYYSQYIPATGDGSSMFLGSPVSGTDGPDQGNNFPGFLVGDGLGGEGDYADTDNKYDNWDIAHVFRTAIGGDSVLNPAGDRCLRRTDESPVYRQRASGPQKVAVYTDEHGMTHVNYRPGTGFNFAGLGVVKDANGGCDVEGVNLLGTSAITAVARYPYQPVTDGPKQAPQTLNKRVLNRFTKFLAAFPKGGPAVNDNVRIVVAHAQDIDGRPFANEKVCFNLTSAAGSLRKYVADQFNAPVIGGYDLRGASLVGATTTKLVCMRTNKFGNAAVEVLHSEGGLLNVIAEFVDERLFRDLKVNFTGTPAPQVPTDPPAPTDPQTPGHNGTVVPPAAGAAGTTAPSAAASATTAKAVAQALNQSADKGATAKQGKKAGARLRYARLETTAKGKRSIVLRVDSANKRAKVVISVRGSGKRSLAKMTRGVATNRKVRITNVAATRSARSVTVTVIG